MGGWRERERERELGVIISSLTTNYETPVRGDQVESGYNFVFFCTGSSLLRLASPDTCVYAMHEPKIIFMLVMYFKETRILFTYLLSCSFRGRQSLKAVLRLGTLF